MNKKLAISVEPHLLQFQNYLKVFLMDEIELGEMESEMGHYQNLVLFEPINEIIVGLVNIFNNPLNNDAFKYLGEYLNELNFNDYNDSGDDRVIKNHHDKCSSYITAIFISIYDTLRGLEKDDNLMNLNNFYLSEIKPSFVVISFEVNK